MMASSPPTRSGLITITPGAIFRHGGADWTDINFVILFLFQWKTNLLCGVYRQELSSSIYLPSVKDKEEQKKQLDIISKKKKHSFMVIKHSLMRFKTTRQEVYFLKDSPEDSQSSVINCSSILTDNIKDPRSSSSCEKFNDVYSREPSRSEFQTMANFQTAQSKQFVRNYSKSRSGSTGELRCADELVNEAMTECCDDERIVNDDDYEVKCFATAVRDCVPSPYDQEALSFRKGDTIMVTKTNVNGIWRGVCRNKEGCFKFVDVKIQNQLRRHAQRVQSQLRRVGGQGGVQVKSKSVSDLLTAIHLENLTSVFVLNGYDTTEDIRQLSVDELDYLGIDESSKDLILRSVGKVSNARFDSRKFVDSGFHSSDSDISTPSLFMPKVSDETTHR